MKTIRFVAVISTALALVPGGAHLFELPHKITLPLDQYLVVQAVYRGWWMLGLLLPAALIANVVLAVVSRGQRVPFAFALVAAAAAAVSLIIFFVWTFPVNQATANWTAAPADWQALRAQWEYSHAVNAAVMFVALCCAAGAAVTCKEIRPAP